MRLVDYLYLIAAVAVTDSGTVIVVRRGECSAPPTASHALHSIEEHEKRIGLEKIGDRVEKERKQNRIERSRW